MMILEVYYYLLNLEFFILDAFHLSLKFVQTLGIYYGKCCIEVFCQKNLSGPKVDLSRKKNSMLLSKRHKRILSIEVHFGPESGRVEATVSEIELKLVMTEIQQIETDVEL